MNKLIYIKFLIILFFVSSCGYTPIFSNKDSNFSIVEISSTGNNKLNKTLISKLDNYRKINSEKKFSLNIDTNFKKEIASKDTKGNPKSYQIIINLKISVIDEKNNLREKSFSKSTNYNNINNKLKLKKYENETSTNLIEKIGEEIIIYLQSI
tara:strand:+ start:168 stop:626 length:459 start_codon:yes stop_codon:yes gene_type:complete